MYAVENKRAYYHLLCKEIILNLINDEIDIYYMYVLFKMCHEMFQGN